MISEAFPEKNKRDVKNSPSNLYRDNIKHLLPVQDKKDLKQKIKNIHTKEVQNTLNSYPPNKVLQAIPPYISKEELKLTRNSRSLLSQLSSGYSRKLNSYKHRIDQNINDKCPDCNSTPHDS